MTTEEYLKQRIKDLENNICDSSLPLKFRKNQAFALLNYRDDLKQAVLENSRRRRLPREGHLEQGAFACSTVILLMLSSLPKPRSSISAMPFALHAAI